MISSRHPSAAGVRLLLLTVLLGLFAMHVLTAHGDDHHGVTAAGFPAHSSTDHSSARPASTTDGSAPAAMVDHDPGRPVEPAAPAAAEPALQVLLVGTATTASAGMEGDGAGLTLCWLLLTAGVALLALLLRAVRSTRRRVPAVGDPMAAGRSRPRAPPGRARLHELVVLRV